MSQFSNSYGSFSEPYYSKAGNAQYPSNSEEDPGSIQIPQTDFDPYYSDLASYDSEIDNNFLNIQELAVPQGLHGVAYSNNNTLKPPALSSFPTDLDSDPPVLPYESDAQVAAYDAGPYEDLPSSPPSSPPRPVQFQYSRNRGNLDSLGISHPFEYRPQSSIARVATVASDYTPGVMSLTQPQPSMPSNLRSPFLAPPLPEQPISPYVDSSPSSSTSALTNAGLPYPNAPHLEINRAVMPNLSPALSEASSVSPDPQSPEHEEFWWQPIVTAPISEQSEAIIEQQRKPKQKRKSCLPDGVVEEYVGVTENEGVYVCLYPNCQRLFKRTYNLRSHIQTHLCDRPYVCKVCEANFVRPHDLRRHERCHSDAKPFVCPCGKGFNRQDAMHRHRMREICEGAISTGMPKTSKPRGRPKGSRNTPTSSPYLNQSPELEQTAFAQQNKSS